MNPNKMRSIFTSFFNKSKTNNKKKLLTFLIGNLITLSILISFVLYHQSNKNKSKIPSMKKLILQTSSYSSCLSSFFFLKKIYPLLDAQKIFYDRFHLQEELKKSCLESNIFEHLKINISNKTIFIKYFLKVPVAYLGNLSNTFIDKSGSAFPATPFFLPQNLPTIFSESFDMKTKTIEQQELILLNKILDYKLPISIIDLSKLKNPFPEIILTLFNQDIIRLSANNFEENLDYYLFLKDSEYKTLENKRMIFDFRIKGFAFTKVME